MRRNYLVLPPVLMAPKYKKDRDRFVELHREVGLELIILKSENLPTK